MLDVCLFDDCFQRIYEQLSDLFDDSKLYFQFLQQDYLNINELQ